MAVKSDLIESPRASLYRVDAACNPETWRRHIALSPDLWDSIFNMDSRPGGRRAERSRNDPPKVERISNSTAPYDSERTGWRVLLARSIVYYITSSDMTHTSVRGPGELSKWELMLPSTHPLSAFSILQCRTDCHVICRATVVVAVDNK